MNRYLVSDLLDMPLESCPSTVEFNHPTVKHNLALNQAWKVCFGIPISKIEIHEYLEGNLYAAPNVNRQMFINYVAGTRKLPQRACPNIRSYERALDDPDVLHREIIKKLNERYGGNVSVDIPVETAYAEIVGKDPKKYFDASYDLIKTQSLATINPVTQHCMRPPQRWTLAAPGNCVGYHDALRSVLIRDFLFVTQASTSVCVFVETIASDSVRPCVIDVLLDEAASNSQYPITIMSDDVDFLKEKRDFFFYGNYVEDDVYQCIPHVFSGFMLVGCSRIPKRLPLTRNAPKSFYYCVNSDLDDEEGINAALAAQSYVMVCDTLKDCSETQKLTKSIVYIAPQFVVECEETTHANEIGIHPESASLAPLAPVVGPDDAGTCKIYLNMKNSDGVLECMANGGVPVVHQKYDGLFDKFNCVVTNLSDFTDDISRADTATIGSNARRCNLVNNEHVFRWIWKTIMTSPCPVKGNSPKHGVMLHIRFLVMYMLVYLQKACEYEVASNPMNTVLVIENRRDIGTVLSTYVSLTNLAPGWGLTLFCTKVNNEFMKKMFPKANVNIKVIENYPSKSFFIEEYNRLMKTASFWKCVPGFRCLLVQNDGTLIRPGLEDHACFGYDYVGAPWKPHPYLNEATKGNLVGNGGLTLRNVNRCTDVCHDFKHERLSVYDMCPIMSEAEDVFFARRIANVCPHDTAKEFSMEQVPCAKALGYHRFWMYHQVGFTLEVFENALADAFARFGSK